MLEILQTLSDDQTALLGCGLAFMGATVMLMMSFHANPKNKLNVQNQIAQKSEKVDEQNDQNQRRAA
ncbi:hypothetical protein OAF98_04040 [Planctomicrobium sp.]|nr:hypothetical protein [Planctomicrobium sp.]MBT5019541.1 hypothetical protein [Planctomicrobium sp.]MDB4733313.1 hypothetical protein [Planctomicrobium sp.]MDB4743634.1 hypothetical protein [Planctomicrobium sp.]